MGVVTSLQMLCLHLCICVFLWQKTAVTTATDNHTTSNVSILDEELRSKIEENARLHKQVKHASLKCRY